MPNVLAYCCHFINVIICSLSQSDHIKQLLVLIQKNQIYFSKLFCQPDFRDVQSFHVQSIFEGIVANDDSWVVQIKKAFLSYHSFHSYQDLQSKNWNLITKYCKQVWFIFDIAPSEMISKIYCEIVKIFYVKVTFYL